jgi:prevent-host-death family protein
MPSVTVEIHEVQPRFAELLTLASAGTEVIVTEGNVPRAKLISLTSSDRARVAGLHAGMITTSTDFDAPLPDDFWAGT